MARAHVTDSLFRRTASWILPHQIFLQVVRHRDRLWQIRNSGLGLGAIRKLIANNRVLRSIHEGRRCFILCNGPTVGTQNLLPLANEIVISVSNGYHHPDFLKFQPRYHCVANITRTRLTEDDIVTWFREMDSRLGDAELFLSYTEAAIVKKHGLFAGRKVHYLFLLEPFEQLSNRAIPDLSEAIPAIQSAPIMALMVALYLGCKDMYLLGVEHDHFKTGVYKYFYEPTVLKGKDISVSADGRNLTQYFELFHTLGQLWRQYRIVGEIANANGARIWNATAGGELDEFPRVKLTDIVDG